MQCHSYMAREQYTRDVMGPLTLRIHKWQDRSDNNGMRVIHYNISRSIGMAWKRLRSTFHNTAKYSENRQEIIRNRQ